MHGHDRIRILLQWCFNKPQPVWLDSRLFLEEREGTIGVYSRDTIILPNITLVKIPKDLVLSVRSCSLSGLISVVPYGLDAQLCLSLALYAEILKGEQSAWHGYLQSLPTGAVDLPLFWDQATIQKDSIDGLEALEWLRGTAVERILLAVQEDGSTLINAISSYYHQVAAPLLLDHLDLWRGPTSNGDPSLCGFYRSFSLVSSRAFLVDAYHGLSMVPIADAFNHVLENHVHLESDYNVCADCGSLDECQHDRDDNQRFGPSKDGIQSDAKNNTQDMYYEMVSNTCIPPLTEVFNTYGDGLTNAQLLSQYGFILDLNDNDRVSWTATEVLHMLVPGQFTDRDLNDYLTDLRQAVSLIPANHVLFRHSQLVYFNPLMIDELCLNSEGKISHHLWILLLLIACRAVRLYLGVDFGVNLMRLLDLQVDLESLVSADDDDDDDYKVETSSPRTDDFDPELLGLLLEMSSSIATLCFKRKHTSGKPGFPNLDIFDLLDALPERRPRTRHAMLILIGERSILDGCSGKWGDFKTTLSTYMSG